MFRRQHQLSRKQAFVFGGVLALMISSSFGAVSLASAATSPGSTSQTLSKLEDRFFEHDYRGEDDTARLNRLEQFVFGETQTGSTADRLARLQTTTVENEATSPIADNQKSQAPLQSEQAVGAANTNAGSGRVLDQSTYPRVSAIEKQLLGKTYDQDPISQRLDRLESKAFGKPSTSNDLCQRVDLLDQYALKHDLFREGSQNQQIAMRSTLLPTSGPMASSGPVTSYRPMTSYGPMSSFGSMSSASDDDSSPAPKPENPFASDVPQPNGVAQRTEVMESVVFGHSFPNRPLEERVGRLEKKLVPYEHNLAQKSLPTRVDQLWSILKAANTLSNPQLSANNNATTASANVPSARSRLADTSGASNDGGAQNQQAAGRHSWLHNLGKVISSTGATTQSGGGISSPNSGPFPGTNWLP